MDYSKCFKCKKASQFLKDNKYCQCSEFKIKQRFNKIKMYYAALGSVDEMVESILYAVLEQLFLPDGKMVRTKGDFDTSIKQGVPKLIETGNEYVAW